MICPLKKQNETQPMQRRLINKDNISSELAVQLYDLAEMRAKNKATNHKLENYGADEIIIELEPLLIPILMEINLPTINEHNKLIKMIEEWYPPNHFEAGDSYKCALVQQALLSSLKNHDQYIEERFQLYYFIIMHDGWKGLAVSKSGKTDKIPDTVLAIQNKIKNRSLEMIPLNEKKIILKYLDETVAEKIKTSQQNTKSIFAKKRDEVTTGFYKLTQEWFKLTIDIRAMLIETILHCLEENMEKRNTMNNSY